MGLRVLVLSGGGVLGALQLGMLETLLSKDGRLDYDIIAGVSVGALAAGILASSGRESGDLESAYDKLLQVWLGIRGNKDVYKFRRNPFAFIRKKGLYQSGPLREKIEAGVCIDKIRKSGRDLFVGVTNANKDSYEEVHHNESRLHDFILASASFPLVIEPVTIGDSIYGDGGIKNNIPFYFLYKFEGMIDKIDILSTSPVFNRTRKFVDVDNILDYLVRTIAGLTRENFTNDFSHYISYGEKYRNADIRVFAPDEYHDINPLEFNPDMIRWLYLEGLAIDPMPLNRCSSPKVFF